MKIHIKYMVSLRCKMAVKEELDKLKFHSDWNWLMEVVDKCSKTACDLGNTAELELKLEMWMFLTQELTSVYCACVEFIKWYNQQNK